MWVLDECGYDARGGAAKVFSTAELAKAAAVSVEEWEGPDDDGGWREKVHPGGEFYSVQPVVVDADPGVDDDD